MGQRSWEVIGPPGYLGSRKEEKFAQWDRIYGPGNWRLGWQTAQGVRLNFDQVLAVYIRGYAKYFKSHPNEADFITNNFAYAFDETPISKQEAFAPYFLFERQGVSNQFHHVALNIALEIILNQPFRGKLPLQVRAGKFTTPVENWPVGWRWHPGRIPCADPNLIPHHIIPGRTWVWGENSIEAFYQLSKILEVKLPK